MTVQTEVLLYLKLQGYFLDTFINAEIWYCLVDENLGIPKLFRARIYYSKGIIPKYYIKFVSVCFKNCGKFSISVLILIVPLLLRWPSFRLMKGWWKHFHSVFICTEFFLVSECV